MQIPTLHNTNGWSELIKKMYATVKFEIVISKQGTTKETGGHRTQNLFEKIKELRSLDVLTNLCYKNSNVINWGKK